MGVEFKNLWYRGIGWCFLPRFVNLMSCSGESTQHTILKQKRETSVRKIALCYFVLLTERPDTMLTVGMDCSLVFLVINLSISSFNVDNFLS